MKQFDSEGQLKNQQKSANELTKLKQDKSELIVPSGSKMIGS